MKVHQSPEQHIYGGCTWQNLPLVKPQFTAVYGQTQTHELFIYSSEGRDLLLTTHMQSEM